MKWIVEKGRLSARQKGSMPRNGLQEHVFTIKTAISDFLHTSGKAFLCFVDIKDAFGSIDHEFMLKELLRSGYPEVFVNITRDIYNGSTFQVKTINAITCSIERRKGIIQGCPWSVIVFEQGIDSWIRWIEQQYQLFHVPNPIQGYVDDVSLFTTNMQEMNTMAEKTTLFMNSSGMEVKPRKCAILHGHRTGNNWNKKTTDVNIEIQGNDIPVYQRSQPYTYLGHKISIDNTSESSQVADLISEFKSNMAKLSSSPLPSSAKVSLINSMCFGPLMFYFCNLHFSVKQLKEIEDEIVDKVRDWFKLNNSSTRGYFFCPRSKGGLGIPNPSVLYNSQHLSFMLDMLNCDDNLVQSAASKSLELHMTKRKIEKVDASISNFAGYHLNETNHFVKTSKVDWSRSMWVELNAECAREGVRLNVHNNKEYFLSLDVDDDVTLNFKAGKSFSKEFKTHKLNEICRDLKEKSSRGRILREMTCVNHSLSCGFISNLKLNDSIRSFAIKSRMQLLECDSQLHLYYPNSFTKDCKICHHPFDTVSHILNGCTKSKNVYQERHNRVVNLTFDKVKYCNRQNMDTVVFSEKNYYTTII
jgi:hypothetical protein